MKIRLFMSVLAFALPEPASSEITSSTSIVGGRIRR
jgi:hypothetical protein